MKLIFMFTILSGLLTLNLCAQDRGKALAVVMDMVHHNPGEPFTQSIFNDPRTLKDYGFNAQVINEFQSVHCAITYESLDKDIFPTGSKERLWVDSLANRISRKIDAIHAQGLNAYYFTDIIVLPRKLVEIYKDEICDNNGNIDISRPKTQEIHRIMLKEVFERFPTLDGLIIRVGETYLHNIPYHIGNGPIKKNEKKTSSITYRSDGGEAIHRDLMNLLRDEVCVKLNKKIFYRTWDFGYFHTVPEYYLNVTEYVPTHPNLFICVKHVRGDYHRMHKFNPTLGIGKHKQVVEVQCQREYEGKGAYPNYIADGVLNGFEELRNDVEPYCLNQLKTNPIFAGIWTWSRGGGWVGPCITNELWCELNTYVLAQWAKDTHLTEGEICKEFARNKGMDGINAEKFCQLALLSADAIVRGRASLIDNINVWWTRDQFISGSDELDFVGFIRRGNVERLLAEKKESIAIWKRMRDIAYSLEGTEKEILKYIRSSTDYGFILYSIFEQGFLIMMKGAEGDLTGVYDIRTLKKAFRNYDKLWKDYETLKNKNSECATLYKPYSFNSRFAPSYCDREKGLKCSVDKYRMIAFER